MNIKKNIIKSNRHFIDSRYNAVAFGSGVKKQKLIQDSFQPDQKFIDKAKEEYFAKGGKITVIEPRPDPVHTKMSKFFPSYAKGFTNGGPAL